MQKSFFNHISLKSFFNHISLNRRTLSSRFGGKSTRSPLFQETRACVFPRNTYSGPTKITKYYLKSLLNSFLELHPNSFYLHRRFIFLQLVYLLVRVARMRDPSLPAVHLRLFSFSVEKSRRSGGPQRFSTPRFHNCMGRST